MMLGDAVAFDSLCLVGTVIWTLFPTCFQAIDDAGCICCLQYCIIRHPDLAMIAHSSEVLLYFLCEEQPLQVHHWFDRHRCRC